MPLKDHITCLTVLCASILILALEGVIRGRVRRLQVRKTNYEMLTASAVLEVAQELGDQPAWGGV